MMAFFYSFGLIGILIIGALVWYIFGGTLKRLVLSVERTADKGLNMLDDLAADQAFKVRLSTSKSTLDTSAELYSMNLNMTPHQMWEAYQMGQVELMSNAQGKPLTSIEQKRFMKAEFRGLMERHLASNQPQQVQPQPQTVQQPQSQPSQRVQPQIMPRINLK